MQNIKKQQEIIRLDRVGLYYTKDTPICFNLDFSFFAGGFYFFTGPSGVGKIFLFKLL